MSEIEAYTTPESSSDGRVLRIATGVGFAALSVLGHMAERQGWMDNWQHLPKEMGTSVAHPAFGYYGAWIATRTKGDWLNPITGVAITTAIDGLAETTQSTVYEDNHDPLKFLDNPYETMKDYIAAFSGMIAYQGINAINKIRRTS